MPYARRMEIGGRKTSSAGWFGVLVVISCLVAGGLGWLVSERIHRRGAPVGPPAVEALGAELHRLPLQTLDGRTVRLRELEARVLVLDFWASWCAPCAVQSKILGQLSSALPPEVRDEVAFVAVNVGESVATVEQSLAEHAAADLVLLDPEARALSELRFAGLPTIVVLDAAGGIQLLRSGITGRRALEAAIESAGAVRMAVREDEA